MVRATKEWLDDKLKRGHHIVQVIAPFQNADVEPVACRPSVEAKEDPRLDPSGRVDLLVTSYRHRLGDADSISAKATIDGLVLCGILKGDGPNEIGEVRYIQHKVGRDESEYTVVEIVKAEG